VVVLERQGRAQLLGCQQQWCSTGGACVRARASQWRVGSERRPALAQSVGAAVRSPALSGAEKAILNAELTQV
jgi:hypothetical protein